LYKRWKNHCPAEADPGDLKKVLRHYLGPWLTEKKGRGSHQLIVEHVALRYHSAFGGKDTLAISLESGRLVKGVYVNHALKAIDCVQLYNKVIEEKE